MPEQPSEPETPQWHFRTLFFILSDRWDDPIYSDVLAPWLAQQGRECRSWLKAFAIAPGDPVPAVHYHELYCLYALSRVSQKLLLRFQEVRQEDGILGPNLTKADYVRFFEQLGLHVEAPESYCPFYHEVVEVIQAPDPDQPPQLLATFWPCLMLGNMLFSRAGVQISVGRSFMDKKAAEDSTIYWTYRCNHRPYSDLSHGWGSNSQWATAFRRDYRIDGSYYLNVDHRFELDMERSYEDPNPLPFEQRAELVMYRHFIKQASLSHAANDPWPWDFGLRFRDGSPAQIEPLGFFLPSGLAVRDYERAEGIERVTGNFHDGVLRSHPKTDLSDVEDQA